MIAMKSAMASTNDYRAARHETSSASSPRNHVGRAAFRPVTLESQDLIEMSYRLRYQTYCLERLLLSADDYADELEFDAYDPVSVHVGVVNDRDHLVGSARLVRRTSAGLPLFRYCTLFPGETTVADPDNVVVELSRVCIDRHQSRLSAGAEARIAAPTVADTPGHAASAYDPFATLIKATYQATKRMAGTHWIVAIERSLRRRIGRYGLPFRLAGPLVDYHGPVEPYVLSLAELDQVILGGRFSLLNDCLEGLEPEFRPQALRGA
jgi:N-acyl amino acid synthase of PEP-CTERM/exosortase system